MVEKSIKMALIENEQLIYLFWTKLAICYNNCRSYWLTTCTQCVPIFLNGGHEAIIPRGGRMEEIISLASEWQNVTKQRVY
jgi:hypothetical protein